MLETIIDSNWAKMVGICVIMKSFFYIYKCVIPIIVLEIILKHFLGVFTDTFEGTIRK